MTLTRPAAKRPTAPHRKRTGQHHRKNPHYTKPYWPYLPIFAVLLAGIVWSQHISQRGHDVLGYATDIQAARLLEDTNAARQKAGETALQLNTQLSSAAQAKASDMATKNYWSHVAPDGTQPWQFITGSGYSYNVAGENLAYGFADSDQVVTAWMQSPEHRRNILDTNYRDVGFASINIPNYQGHGAQTLVVALYGAPGTTAVRVAPLERTAATPVSRVALMQPSASWLTLLLAALTGSVLTLFLVRHTLAWHRVLVRGEQFVLKHPLLDTAFIGLAVVGIVLSRAAGIIL